MATVNCSRVAALAVAFGWATYGSPAHADWAACQKKPTRSCLIEEALRGENGPLAGKDRLDVLLDAGVLNHLEDATTGDLKEAQRLARSAPSPGRYLFLAIQGLAATIQWQEAFDLAGSSDGSLHSVAFAELMRAMVRAGKQNEIAGLGMQMPSPFDANHMVTELDCRDERNLHACRFGLADAGPFGQQLWVGSSPWMQPSLCGCRNVRPRYRRQPQQCLTNGQPPTAVECRPTGQFSCGSWPCQNAGA